MVLGKLWGRKMWLFLLFVAVPIIEIGLFIQVGGALGLWPTLVIVVLTALVGTALMRAQGMAAMQKMQRSLENGQNPADPIANGAFILVAGLLLLTPGFFTDSFGLLLLIPQVRALLIAQIAKRIKSSGSVYSSGFGQTGPGSEVIIDADFEVVEDNINTKPGHSGWTKPKD